MINKGLGKRTLSIENRGALEECRYLCRQGDRKVHPYSGLRRSYSEKELFQEGRMINPGGLCKPRVREVNPDSQGGLGTKESKRETFCSHCEP